MLPAVPCWALSFGFAADVLVARSRRVGIPVLAVLALCGLVSLDLRDVCLRLDERVGLTPRAGLLARRGAGSRGRCVGWGASSGRLRRSGLSEDVRSASSTRRGATLETPRDPHRDRSAELGALRTVVETNGVTASVAGDASEAASDRRRLPLGRWRPGRPRASSVAARSISGTGLRHPPSVRRCSTAPTERGSTLDGRDCGPLHLRGAARRHRLGVRARRRDDDRHRCSTRWRRRCTTPTRSPSCRASTTRATSPRSRRS